jgi:hypothetical protein
MIVLALLADVIALTPPDITPLHDAVAKCDRDALASFAKAEPHRRAEFGDAFYSEQRSIAADRVALADSAGLSAAGRASLEAARGALDSRQKRLDDAKLVEKAWRDAVDELRADYLANCDLRKKD